MSSNGQVATSISFGLTANHSLSSLEPVVALLGVGEFAVGKGTPHSDGSLARESVWISGLIEVTAADLGKTASGWLNEHGSSLRTLLAGGWDLSLDIRVVAVDPLTSLPLEDALLDAVSVLHGLNLQVTIFPKPRLLDVDE